MSADPAGFLFGPRAEVPPPWIEAHWPVVAAAAGLALGLGWLAWRVASRRRRPEDPAEACRRALADAAAAAAPAERASRAADALRAYLAAVVADAPAGLSTEELAARCGRSPLLATAADPVIRALRASDAAKFAGEAVDADRVLAQASESLARVELARRALWKEALR